MKYEPKDFFRGILETKKPCPHCEHPPEPMPQGMCVLNRNLMMVIGPQGVHLDCPVHPEGHHIFGPQVTC